jgi:ATP-binding protein involved in chromosome partitioning
MLGREEVLDILRSVKPPDTGTDVVSLGAVKEITTRDGLIAVRLSLQDAEPAVKWILEARCKKALREREPAGEIQVDVEVSPSAEKAVSTHRESHQIRGTLTPGIRHPIAVASGKGGVGKSTVAVNLAFSLAAMGKSTGLFDADIYGPNVPRMLGIEGRVPEAVKGKIVPIEENGLRVMSLGLIARPDQAMIWRGPMVSKAIEQMLAGVQWGELDYLIIDLPPGTGDAQLTLSQRLSLSGAVMVTTPQDVSLSDVRRGILMFRNVDVPILGLVENMAYYCCPSCGEKAEIFPGTGIAGLIEDFSIELLGRIPIDPRISSSGDAGKPVVLSDPDGEVAMVFKAVARSLVDLTAPPSG